MADIHKATISAVETLAPHVLQLTISFSDAFSFAPGQYVSLRFSDQLSRAYCIASAPERPEAIQLCIRLGKGKGAAALEHLSVGSPIDVEGPLGDFILPEQDNRKVLLIAGDTGIAPVRSIVLHMLAIRDRRRITVLFEPDENNLLYEGDFRPLADAGDLTYESGDIGTLLGRHRAEVAGSIVMAAGFDPFLRRVQEAVEKAGGSRRQMIVETFGKAV